MGNLTRITHKADLCVVGGGLAGMFTAISAARHGVKVVLMHDRPVLGGNASSEIRMWVCGAGTRVRNLQETGIMEEIFLDNMHRNPTRNFAIWDTLLYEKVRFEPNIELLLNCACMEAECDDGHIKSITGFQTTTYTFHKVEAPLFADCSGDSILAPLTGAKFMRGKEARSQFGEEFAPEEATHETMGMSLMIQVRETDHVCKFTPPEWAYTFKTDEEMNYKPHDIFNRPYTNFYWVEIGGTGDTIADTEKNRDELLKIAYGAWDHVKNQGDHGADNWELEWIGFIPGKRESLRYVGDYIMTQHDVEGGKIFDDTVAYGGWQIDEHLSGGFYLPSKGGAHLRKKRLTEPYGIPFRSLYSENIDNLMFAGRNLSASHVAFATARVMATCGLMGQAIGTASSIATREGILPREIGQKHIKELQKLLMDDDCFLPHFTREPSELAKKAKLSADWGDCSALLSGTDRRIWGADNGYYARLYRPITYTFDEKTHVGAVRLVLDSDLDREQTDGDINLNRFSMPIVITKEKASFGFPRTLLRAFRIEAVNDGGEWETVYETETNHQRFLVIPIDVDTKGIRLIPVSTYGNDLIQENYGSGEAHIFNFEVMD